MLIYENYILRWVRAQFVGCVAACASESTQKVATAAATTIVEKIPPDFSCFGVRILEIDMRVAVSYDLRTTQLCEIIMDNTEYDPDIFTYSLIFFFFLLQLLSFAAFMFVNSVVTAICYALLLVGRTNSVALCLSQTGDGEKPPIAVRGFVVTGWRRERAP